MNECHPIVIVFCRATGRPVITYPNMPRRVVV